MIEIGKILFKFAAQDERFAYKLYVGWNEFCHSFVEKCIEETLSGYDKQGVPLVINRLNLNIGSIPEEDFYRLFPIRFKEELEKLFGRLPEGHNVTNSTSPPFPIDGLLFYLSHGYHRTTWENKEVDLDHILKTGMESEPGMMADLFMRCLDNTVMLERFLLQSSDENFFIMIILWIKCNLFSHEEKRWQLFLLLSGSPKLFLSLSERISENKRSWTQFVELAGINMFRQVEVIVGQSLPPALKEYLNEYPEDNSVNKSLLSSHAADRWHWITDGSLSLYERQRRLAILLENDPVAVMQLIHGSDGDELIVGCLIEVMDDIFVWKVMQEESKCCTDMDGIRYSWWLYNRLLEFISDADIPLLRDRDICYRRLYGAVIRIVREKKFSTGISGTELTSMFLEMLAGTDGCEGFSGKESHDSMLAIFRQRLVKENPGISSIQKKILLLINELTVKGNEYWDSFFKRKSDKRCLETDGTLYRIGLQACLMDADASIEFKQEQLEACIFFCPEEILRLFHTKESNKSVIQILKDSLSEQALIRIIAAMSIPKAELLRQTIRCLRNIYQSGKPSTLLADITDYACQETLFQILCEMGADKVVFGHKEYIAIVKSFIRIIEERFPDTINSCDKDKEDDKGSKKEMNQPIPETGLAEIVLEKLILTSNEAMAADTGDLLEYLVLSNAGVTLLTPWFPRLFTMLGLLNEEKNDFKDVESRIRAIFLIQRLVTSEDREYKEQELAFNRILVSLPFSVPLPKQLSLSREETEIIDSMLSGVKANWSAMQNTSIDGFRRSFIERSGYLEQKEDKWIITVDEQSYDMLLDSLPWSYKLIRFPWLKKQIHVLWRNKEEMDY